mmetsp:Transcript_60671/g.128454  ORF Transcript_60671/g.128454 Transcript_60671/m.128454 type:complete len:218 (+) Transcript_60671:174-827(+)|eukprot:CAMPEP_0206588696 /NCGR_PEP_ID=MMETSP0325_2-20121206/38456_1 /ASSEMBLY_ACC=CAM_ASM_000347 /TAXON_ID=2866 /ORGANISM="Crypthecodinium cohnii, Strain Seligo" /LENGTH=217 /DNA_ID=CAMNT_0054097063 /DNA_START=107 /DNA_END=760 /DNA_ORIENTATION=-
MGAGVTIFLTFAGLFTGIFLMWMAVPTEQTLAVVFPNVIILGGMGSESILPISFDNNSLPELTAAETTTFNGFYRHDPLFYHHTLDRFLDSESRRSGTYIFSCAVFCGPTNSSGKLALLHKAPEPKKNLWYLLEFRDGDVNSPIIIARSKFRKDPTWTAPWVTVSPGGDIKAKDLPEVYMTTAWDALRFDTPLKWGCTVAIVGAIALACWSAKEKED